MKFKIKKRIIMLAIIIALGIFGAAFGLKAYPGALNTGIYFEKTGGLRPSEPFVVHFSFPVSSESYSDIKISPAQDVRLRWKDSGRKLEIAPSDFWKPGTNYEVELPEGRNAVYASIEARKAKFSTEDYPKISGIIPEDGSENVMLDIEDPIVVNFEKSAADFFVKFELFPQKDLTTDFNAAKTRFKVLPSGALDYSSNYTLKVYAKYYYDQSDDYRLIGESKFKTHAPPVIAWDKDYNVRLTQAKEYTPAKITNGKYIDINLKAQVLSIFEDGKLLDSYMVSSGKPGMETPKGETQIYNKTPRAYSKSYGLYMPDWMALTSSGKFGIHELPEWPNGYKEGAAHLGIPVSHGCVRLGVGAAKRVYDWAEVGTPVIIY